MIGGGSMKVLSLTAMTKMVKAPLSETVVCNLLDIIS